MSNAIFLLNNIIDDASKTTISGTPGVVDTTGMPLKNLLRDERFARWRSNLVSTVDVLVGSSYTGPIECVAIADHNLTTNRVDEFDVVTIRVQVWSDNFNGVNKVEDITVDPFAGMLGAGNFGSFNLSEQLLSHGIVTDAGDGKLRPMTFIRFANGPRAANASFIKITFTNSISASFVEASRLYVGPVFEVGENFNFDWNFGRVELNTPLITPGGQEYVNPVYEPRFAEFQMDWIGNTTERDQFLSALMFYGTYKPLWCFPYPDTAKNQNYFGIYGRVKGAQYRPSSSKYDRMPVRIVEAV